MKITTLPRGVSHSHEGKEFSNASEEDTNLRDMSQLSDDL